MGQAPTVSVILPVWNCPTYVAEAIRSILGQTLVDFELIIVDDGSTDNTPAVLRTFNDPRIKLITQDNRGLPGALNTGITHASGKYIARQDQDDISAPERLAAQVDYMEEHRECALLGTWARIYKENHATERYHRHPHHPLLLRYYLLFDNPFVHSSVLIRKSTLDEIGPYSTDPERQPPEDFELWSRIAKVASVANLPRVLLSYREVPGSMSRNGDSPFRGRLVRLCAENISAAASLPTNDLQCHNIAALFHGASDLLRRPDAKIMERCLRKAALAICGDPLPAEAERHLHSRIKHIREALTNAKGRYLYHGTGCCCMKHKTLRKADCKDVKP
jgi:glycosyltransferase involved in cell wall biosynthesis